MIIVLEITPRRRTERRRSAQRRAPNEAPRRAAGTAAPQGPAPPGTPPHLVRAQLLHRLPLNAKLAEREGRAGAFLRPADGQLRGALSGRLRASQGHRQGGLASPAGSRPLHRPRPTARRPPAPRLPPRPVRSRPPRAVRPPAPLGLSSRPRRGRCPAQRLFIKTRGRQRRPSWGWVT